MQNKYLSNVNTNSNTNSNSAENKLKNNKIPVNINNAFDAGNNFEENSIEDYKKLPKIYKNNFLSLQAKIPGENKIADSFNCLKSENELSQNLIKNVNSEKKYRYLDESVYKRYSQLNMYKGKTFVELKEILIRIRKILILIDALCFMLDLAHFSQVENQNTIDNQATHLQWICLFISIFVCVLIILRIFQKIKYENLNFLIDKSNEILQEKIKIKFLILEIILHLIQPIPGVDIHWDMKVLGNTVVYSVSGFLFSFSILRLYVCFKIIKTWNLYSNEKSKRIFKFFQNKNICLFLYKANIKAKSLITLFIIISFFLYIFTIIFKIYEFYDIAQLGFDHILNCLWYLVTTVTIIGYGDYVPHTGLGRAIGVIVCVIGIFLFSLLIIAMMQTILLDSEEEKAFKQFDLIKTKSQKNNLFLNYTKDYIKYKMWRIKKEKDIKDFFTLQNNYHIQRENNLIEIKKNHQKNFEIEEFCENFSEIWNEEILDVKFNTAVNCHNIAKSLGPLMGKAEGSLNNFRESKKMSFRLFNLSRLMMTLGNKYEISDIYTLRGRNLVSAKNFNATLKEFHVKYFDRKLKIKNNRQRKSEMITDNINSMRSKRSSEDNKTISQF